jgi:dihydroorotase
MKLAGAIAYGDHKKSIKDSSLMKIALEYSKSFGGLVISYSNDESLSSNGVMNEGLISTSLGLKGLPNISESIQVYRDLEILEYTSGMLHIPYISTAKSIGLIRDAKKKGLNITSSVSLAHLILNEHDLSDYNTNLKLSPPLRSKKDSDLLKDALLDGTIDYVTSMHEPIDIDNKKVEFDNALSGSIGLECVFGVLSNIFPLDKVIDILTRRKSELSITQNKIQVGSNAEMALFDPDFSYRFEEDHILSTSKNCAFIGQKMNGKVYGAINNDSLCENKLWI